VKRRQGSVEMADMVNKNMINLVREEEKRTKKRKEKLVYSEKNRNFAAC
jgi:hypothetical protein